MNAWERDYDRLWSGVRGGLEEVMPEIEATRQIGAGTKFTDRQGRVWECKSYNSPSGPAFWITLPEEFWPAGTANYTVHFDGVMGVSQGDPA